ncbi:MAG: leucine-rich repeat domain-containing protein [Propionibacteriaceae bacterium]|nr:leucine-rich repeat domain-containing protein [Propionibacteriaceae bacterium]
MHRHIVSTLVAATTLALVGLGLGASPAFADDGNVIPDPALQACLNDELGQTADAAITQGELAQLDHVDCESMGIKSIAGLQYATGLATGQSGLVWLGGNQISDLAPLSGLTGIMWLRLNNNQITDIGALANLTKVSNLALNNNQISSIAALSHMPELQELGLSGNQISDLAPLTGLSDFLDVNVANNHVTDLTPVSSTGWLGNTVHLHATDQTLTASATVGQTLDLPALEARADMMPVAWTVANGGATLSDGTVTLAAAGTATLAWMDPTGQFTGTLTITVAAPQAPVTKQPAQTKPVAQVQPAPSSSSPPSAPGASADTGGTIASTGSAAGLALALVSLGGVVLVAIRVGLRGLGVA